jgi:hypothetical protein
MEFTFKPIAGSEHPLQWLKSAFNELLAHICRGFDGDDFVGLELENCAFPSRPVGVSFRKLSQLTVDVVLGTLAKVLQSNAAFCTNDRLSVRLDAIRPPTGHGFSAVYGRCVTFNEFSLSKNSIFVIQNDDSSCLAAALVVAVEYQKSGLVGSVVKLKFSGVRGRELLTQMARELCQNAGVDLSHGGRYEHVELFQNYLTEYTIVVYSSRSGTTRYFTGDMASGRPRFEFNYGKFPLQCHIQFNRSFFSFLFLRMVQPALLRQEAPQELPIHLSLLSRQPPMSH